jgi:4-hydroxybenzoate polyprenyltransferase
MNQVKKYLSLVKFSHTIFALPFALIGFFWAVKLEENELHLMTLLFVFLDMVWARNAAMAFNRYIDRDIDLKNERTEERDIPSGNIKASSALIFVIINSVLFLVTTYFINTTTFYLAPVALLVVLGYSYTKRFTALCHLVLGLGLALAPIGAYLAVTGEFAWLPVLLSFVVLFWVSGFDIIYALQDEEFDKSQNLNSIPVLIGKRKALLLSSFLHFIAFALLVTIALIANFGILFWIGLLFFGALLVYQHTLVKPNDLSKVNLAFFTTNGIGSVVFGLFSILELYL